MSTYKEPTMWVDDFGSKCWYLNGNYHRQDGPAVQWANGHKSWWLHGKLHRQNGPAVEWSNGEKEWWLHGKRYATQDEYWLAD